MNILMALITTIAPMENGEVKNLTSKDVKTFITADEKEFGRYVSVHFKSLNLSLAEVPVTAKSPVGLSTDLKVKMNRGFYEGLALGYGWHF